MSKVKRRIFAIGLLVWDLGGTIAVSAQTVAPPSTTTTSIQPRRQDPSRRERWRRLPAMPIAGRAGAVAVWTGKEVIVWQGYGSQIDSPPFALDGRSDGARFDPVTETWRVLPEAPFVKGNNEKKQPEDRALENGFSSGVWTGREFFVWDGVSRSAATYDPTSDRWRRIPKGPLEGRKTLDIAWDGQRVIMIGAGTGGKSERVAKEVRAFDPASGTWTRRPNVPTPMLQPRLVPFGDRVFLYDDTYLDPNKNSVRAMYSLQRDGKAWRTEPELPLFRTTNLDSYRVGRRVRRKSIGRCVSPLA